LHQHVATAAPEIPVLARDQAFESLYRCYVKDVYHYALAVLRNPADAEDVTQTTFLNAYRAYQRGIEVEKPHNWLIKIAHNAARTRHARAARRVKEVPLDDHLELLAVPEIEQPDVAGVLRALGRLPFNQRAALVMRELEGRSYAEIADTIGVSVSAVETLIFRARKSLRLKASGLRALAAVPLPSSLTQLFEGGGAVAGGGAVVGTGLLVKVAVALVAGVVATGVGVNRNGLIGIAGGSTSGAANVQSRPGADGFTARADARSAAVKATRAAVRNGVLPGRGTIAAGSKQPGPFTTGGAVQPRPGSRPGSLATGISAAATAVASAVSETSSATASSSSSTPTIPQVASPVSTVIAAVQTVAQAVAAVPPIHAPSLPPVRPSPPVPPVVVTPVPPVALPKVPGAIPLP
jgi:RNA polymerase sigma factor (sigma-70 family)